MTKYLSLYFAVSFAIFVSLISHGIPAVQPESTKSKQQQEAILLNQTWLSLDREARKVITERAKYVYRFGDKTIVDAYPMMYWQKEANSNITKTRKTQNYKYGANMSIKKTISVSIKYKDDLKLQTYFSIPSYPCNVWYKGLLVNNMDLWETDEYRPLRDDFGLSSLKGPELVIALKRKASSFFPTLIAIDPAAKKDPNIQVYHLGTGKLTGSFTLLYGFVGRFDMPQTTMDAVANGLEGPIQSENRERFFLVPGKNVRNGLPHPTLNSFALVPLNPLDKSKPVFGGNSRKPQDARFDIHELKRHRMSPKELAKAFVDGELEIPYRKVTRTRGKWICEEKLLARP